MWEKKLLFSFFLVQDSIQFIWWCDSFLMRFDSIFCQKSLKKAWKWAHFIIWHICWARLNWSNMIFIQNSVCSMGNCHDFNDVDSRITFQRHRYHRQICLSGCINNRTMVHCRWQASYWNILTILLSILCQKWQIKMCEQCSLKKIDQSSEPSEYSNEIEKSLWILTDDNIFIFISNQV